MRISRLLFFLVSSYVGSYMFPPTITADGYVRGPHCITTPGEHFADGCLSEGKRMWSVLIADTARTEIRQVQVSIEKIGESPEDDQCWGDINVKLDIPNVVLLISGLNRFGSISPQGRASHYSFFDSTGSIRIGTLKKSYSIAFESKDSSRFIVISDGHATQRIEQPAVIEVEWIGDIDGDGRLDLVVEIGGGDGGGKVLYLSGLATQGQLVGEAGSFWDQTS